MADILIELFSEEIPARMQAKAADDFKKLMTNGLVDAGITYGSAVSFVTPRRLTLFIEGALEASRPVREERKGPRVDAPEKAIEGFLRSTGLSKEALEIRDDAKGQVYFAVIEKPGRDAREIIAECLEATIRNFPWPKSMRWGAGSLRWVRPLHSILALFITEDSQDVIAIDSDGIQSGGTTEGHRFMGQGRFAVSGFDDYEAKLLAHHVMLRSEARAEKIWADATTLAFAQGLEVIEDQGLLSEVAGLVEWPVVLMGDIGAAFLNLPPEVLQTSMKEHQKFFSVKNPKTGRIEKFITVANRETADHGATILAGNQKVLTARLSDAKFFWENDLRIAQAGMAPWLEALENVTFHNKIGSQAERIKQIAALAGELAPAVGASPDQAEEAAKLAKADLSSEMVYEFPELQGLMGRYYISEAGKEAAIAAAAEEHYSPLGPSDQVPTAPISVAVALADKINLLTGFWAIDEKPTGSKDPFALRRAALGVIRLILENDLELSLLKTLSTANEKTDAVDLLSFIHDRLKVYLRDQGIRHDVIDACIAMEGNDDLNLLAKRARSLQAFLNTDDGENLVQGYKRAVNILEAEERKDGVSYELDPDPSLAQELTEKTLFTALDQAETALKPKLERNEFDEAMAVLAGLRAPIDQFFEAVQINTDVQITRRNRLCLLNRIRNVMHKIVIFSKLDG